MTTKVEDIMTRKVLTVASTATLRDVSWGLSLKRVQGAPVKDDRGRLVGILTQSEIGVVERVSQKPEKVRAIDVMTPILYAIRRTDSVKDAARRFVDTGCHQLVVFDEDDKVVGLVTPADVMKLLLRDDIDL